MRLRQRENPNRFCLKEEMQEKKNNALNNIKKLVIVWPIAVVIRQLENNIYPPGEPRPIFWFPINCLVIFVHLMFCINIIAWVFAKYFIHRSQKENSGSGG